MTHAIISVLSTVPEVDSIAVSSSANNGLAVYSFVPTVSQFVYGPLMHAERLLAATMLDKRFSFHVRGHRCQRWELAVPAGAVLIWKRKK